MALSRTGVTEEEEIMEESQTCCTISFTSFSRCQGFDGWFIRDHFLDFSKSLAPKAEPSKDVPPVLLHYQAIRTYNPPTTALSQASSSKLFEFSSGRQYSVLSFKEGPTDGQLNKPLGCVGKISGRQTRIMHRSRLCGRQFVIHKSHILFEANGRTR